MKRVPALGRLNGLDANGTWGGRAGAGQKKRVSACTK